MYVSKRKSNRKSRAKEANEEDPHDLQWIDVDLKISNFFNHSNSSPPLTTESRKQTSSSSSSEINSSSSDSNSKNNSRRTNVGIIQDPNKNTKAFAFNNSTPTFAFNNDTPTTPDTNSSLWSDKNFILKDVIVVSSLWLHASICLTRSQR